MINEIKAMEIEKLREKYAKIFQLEGKLSYSNRAVFGGLQKLAETWQGEAREAGLPEKLINEISSRIKKYEILEPEARRQTLVEIGQLLGITGIVHLPLFRGKYESLSYEIEQVEKPTTRTEPPQTTRRHKTIENHSANREPIG
ncbi:MAG: hypothetical protein ABFD51_01880, partial [Anaerolineaceae bacterium]